MPKICGQPCAQPCKPIRTSVLLPGEAYGNQRLEESVKDLKPQLGRTEALAEDLKQQVELLRRDYKEIAEVLRGV